MKIINVAITGSSGFLGKHLLKSLNQENFHIKLFDKTKHNLEKIESLEDFLTGADVVVHLAGANRDSTINLLKVNVLGTQGLLEASTRYCKSAKFILASSAQVYWQNSFYGLSKKLAEESIDYYTRLSKIKGVILRVSNIYGLKGRPFYNSVIATFLHQIVNEQAVLIHGDGEQKRDYIYVADVVSAIKAAILYQQKYKCEHFNITSGTETSLNEIIKILEKILKRHVNVRYENAVRAKQKFIPSVNDNSWATLGWQPEISLEHGLRLILENYPAQQKQDYVEEENQS